MGCSDTANSVSCRLLLSCGGARTKKSYQRCSPSMVGDDENSFDGHANGCGCFAAGKTN